MRRTLAAALMAGIVLGQAGESTSAATVLVEAESFSDHGGWSLDT
jgi:hypothetical protein